MGMPASANLSPFMRSLAADGVMTAREAAQASALLVIRAASTISTDVIDYARPVTSKGPIMMDGFGSGSFSATGQVAGSANVLCFSAGRGSVVGCKATPSIKLVTDTSLYERMPDYMDVDCGTIADETETAEQCGTLISKMILQVAFGELTKSELMDFGDDGFVPWKLGATV